MSRPLATPTARPGTVYLVGAGPGSADLVTLRGWRLLQLADVVVHDHLVDPELYRGLAAECVDAGKRTGGHGMTQEQTNSLLIDLARANRRVVRLKGGDPFVLGRGSEEAIALAAAGVPCEVVPGVSSSLAAPLLAGIPLTHRGLADAFCVVSAHRRDDGAPPAIPPFHARRTLVVLMGVATLDAWLPVLQDLEYPPDLPVAFVTWAARQGQAVLVTRLDRCREDALRAGVRSPSVAVFGKVVTLRDAILAAAPAGEPEARP